MTTTTIKNTETAKREYTVNSLGVSPRSTNEELWEKMEEQLLAENAVIYYMEKGKTEGRVTLFIVQELQLPSRKSSESGIGDHEVDKHTWEFVNHLEKKLGMQTPFLYRTIISMKEETVKKANLKEGVIIPESKIIEVDSFTPNPKDPNQTPRINKDGEVVTCGGREFYTYSKLVHEDTPQEALFQIDSVSEVEIKDGESIFKDGAEFSEGKLI